MISYVLPTRDRTATLNATLRDLASLPAHDAQLVIVDNASTQPCVAPRSLSNGVQVHIERLRENQGTGGRNAGVVRALASCGSASLGSAASNHWIIMLDDDSAPLSLDFLPLLASAQPDEAVIAAEVLLEDSPDGTQRHESGGLPEVPIGCGAAIRADVWTEIGGYDPTFDYYAEEYDFAARMLLAGMRVRYDRRFQVRHRKVSQGRDMNRILCNLVRNNAWVMARYAPDDQRGALIQHQIDRYAIIAHKENATAGYQRGLAQLQATLSHQPRRPLNTDKWQRFTGYAAVAATLRRAATSCGILAIVNHGKNVEVIEQAARDVGMTITPEIANADTLLIGSLSPGPMLDATAMQLAAHPSMCVLPPWTLAGAS